MIDEVCWSRDDNNDNTFLDHSTLLIMKDLDSGKKQNKKELNEKLLLKKKKVIKNKNIVNNSNNKIGSSSNNKSKSKSKSILKKDKDNTTKGNVVLQYNEEKTKSKNKQNKKSSNSNSKITSKSKTSNNTNRSSSNNNNNIRNKSNSRLTLNADKPKQTFSPNTSRKNSQSPKNETNKQNNNNTNNIKHLKVHQTKLPKCKGKNTPIQNNNNNTNTNNNSQPQQTKLIPSSKNPLPNIPKIQTKITPIQLKNAHHVHSPSYKHILPNNNNNTNTNNNLLHSSPTQILDESQCKRITRDRSHRQPFSGISQEYIDKKKQFFMDLMRDPNNPYSLYWSNKMLSKGFGVTTNVKGTLNCVPNLGLINFNNSHSQLPYTNNTIYSPEELSTITKIKRCQYEHLKHNNNNNNDNHNDKSLSHNASTFYNISKYYIPKTTERTSSCNTKLKLVQYPSIYKYFQ
jgi:hypothetical protein